MKLYHNLKQGDKIGKFVFIERTANSKGGKIMGLVQCFCGNITETYLYRAAGKMLSCGCIRYDTKPKGKDCAAYRHGEVKSPEYNAWKGLTNRGTNPNDKNSKDYFDRGIRVCERWQGENGFINFLSDMGKKPSPIHTIDRYPNNDGIYEPVNCRWATPKEQAANRRSSVRLTINGETMIVAEWGRKTGIPSGTILRRFHKGWNPEDCILPTYPIRNRFNSPLKKSTAA